MKLEEIKELMKAMEENDIASFEYNEGEVHLSLRRGPQEVVVQAPAAPQAPAALPAAPAAEAPLSRRKHLHLQHRRQRLAETL